VGRFRNSEEKYTAPPVLLRYSVILAYEEQVQQLLVGVVELHKVETELGLGWS